MYLARTFNENELFQYFGGWKKEKEKNTNLFNEFLLRANSAYLNISRIDRLSRFCIDQFDRQKYRLEMKGQRIIFWSPTVTEIINEFSPFLSSVRIMQNIILRLASKECNINSQVPKSLNDAIKFGLDKYGMKQEIIELFMRYWNESGILIKNYRDIDQHYYSIAKHCYIETVPENRILIFLPDDPSKKGQKDISFENEINAINFFKEEFFKFHDFVEDVSITLGFSKVQIEQPAEGNVVFDEMKRERKTLFLVILDTETGLCVELGQQEDVKNTKLFINYHGKLSLRPNNGIYSDK